MARLLDTMEVEVQEVAATHGDLWTWGDVPRYSSDTSQALKPTRPELPKQYFNYGPGEEVRERARNALVGQVLAKYPDLKSDVVHAQYVCASPWTMMAALASEGRVVWYWSRIVTFKAHVYEPAEETP